MPDTPKILTVEEIDAILARIDATRTDDGYPTTRGIPEPDETLSLLRMAKAMAVMQRHGASLRWRAMADSEGIPEWVALIHGRGGAGACAVEAIEAAEAASHE